MTPMKHQGWRVSIPWLPLSDLEVTCDPGFILDISKLQEGGTKEECCLKSCEFFKCHSGHISDHRVEQEGQVRRVKTLMMLIAR